MILPVEFKNNMERLLGIEYESYERALESERLYGLRVNTLKISCEEFERIVPFEVRKIPYIPNGYFYDGVAVQPAKHPYYFAGLYYLQDPSAMTPASRLPVRPGMRVLDLCAAPGGKSTELAVKLAGEGLLVANDISPKRAKALQKNIELFGVANSLITTEYPDKLAGYFPAFFDCILIDAPCSGEGMFRKDPAMVKAWTPESNAQYAAMQEDIVRAALRMLRPDGYLLYSTCTFSPMEDEATVLKMLQMDPSLEVVEMDGYEGFAEGRPDMVELSECAGDEGSAGGTDEQSLSVQLKKCVRIYPHRMDGEGHFLTLLHKKAVRSDEDGQVSGLSEDIIVAKNKKKTKASGVSSKLSKEEKAIWEEFSAGISRDFDASRIESHDGMLYYNVDGLPDARGLKFIRSGLFLGECKKKRFEPSQTLAMALKYEEFKNAINFSSKDDNIIRYLKGETVILQSNPDDSAVTDSGDYNNDVRKPGDVGDGTVLICVDGYPLGWGKKNGNTIKNKYHPGWRLM